MMFTVKIDDEEIEEKRNGDKHPASPAFYVEVALEDAGFTSAEVQRVA